MAVQHGRDFDHGRLLRPLREPVIRQDGTAVLIQFIAEVLTPVIDDLERRGEKGLRFR